MQIKFVYLYKLKKNTGLTLIELLLASALLSVVILGVSAIDFYYRNQAMGQESRLRAQQEASLVLEHMTRNLSLVMGSAVLGGIDFNPGPRLKARIDRNNNGVIDAADDVAWIGYRYFLAEFRVEYYPQHNAGSWGPGGITEVLSARITAFTIALEDNTLIVSVKACANPGIGVSPENPEVEMQTRIHMFGYSY